LERKQKEKGSIGRPWLKREGRGPVEEVGENREKIQRDGETEGEN